MSPAAQEQGSVPLDTPQDERSKGAPKPAQPTPRTDSTKGVQPIEALAEAVRQEAQSSPSDDRWRPQRIAGSLTLTQAGEIGFTARPVDERFNYEPLDQNQSSIRLIYILDNLSEEGLVQCRMFHTTTDASYMCLSYVWEYSPTEEPFCFPKFQVILVNGRKFNIRENLWKFLSMAQRNGSAASKTFDLSTPLWIDALCIDQSNSSERNHQVAQMGVIYKRATAVQVWLGEVPLSLLHKIGKERKEFQHIDTGDFEVLVRDWVSPASPDHPDIRLRAGSEEFDKLLFKFVLQNAYWERAWIVQEVFLAQKLTFWLHTMPMDARFLRALAACIFKTPFSQDVLRRPQHDYTHYLDYQLSLSQKIEKASLISLLDRFSNKECANAVDRVFSLLSLCTMEETRIKVDYEVATERLAYDILRNHTGQLCICSVIVVMRALQDKLRDWSSFYGKGEHDAPWIEFTVPERDIRFFTRAPSPERGIRRLYSFPRWRPTPKSINFETICRFSGKHNFYTGYWDDGPSPTKMKHSFRATVDDFKGTSYTVRMALSIFHTRPSKRIHLCERAKSTSTTQTVGPVRLGW